MAKRSWKVVGKQCRTMVLEAWIPSRELMELALTPLVEWLHNHHLERKGYWIHMSLSQELACFTASHFDISVTHAKSWSAMIARSWALIIHNFTEFATLKKLSVTDLKRSTSQSTKASCRKELNSLAKSCDLTTDLMKSKLSKVSSREIYEMSTLESWSG